ncbi:MAG: hypothetical protein LBL08_02095 [Candidatus Nomurabacteria bacterium]|jgi:hypothetical protein|nr:hypothetical protein [Candidatus Nomurabacteria bacterium]
MVYFAKMNPAEESLEQMRFYVVEEIGHEKYYLYDHGADTYRGVQASIVVDENHYKGLFYKFVREGDMGIWKLEFQQKWLRNMRNKVMTQIYNNIYGDVYGETMHGFIHRDDYVQADISSRLYIGAIHDAVAAINDWRKENHLKYKKTLEPKYGVAGVTYIKMSGKVVHNRSATVIFSHEDNCGRLMGMEPDETVKRSMYDAIECRYYVGGRKQEKEFRRDLKKLGEPYHFPYNDAETILEIANSRAVFKEVAAEVGEAVSEGVEAVKIFNKKWHMNIACYYRPPYDGSERQEDLLPFQK